MNDVRAFRGLRFDEGVVGPLGSVVCPPYDVISPLEQVELHGRNPHNVVRLELGFEFPEDDDHSNRYARSAATLERWLEEGALRAEKEPALYLYAQQFVHEGRVLTRPGLLARLRLAPWEEGTVLPHEETMSKPKEDRLRLMRATACNLSPLFLLFDDPTGTVRGLMDEATRTRQEAAIADTGDGQLHRLWVLGNTLQRRLLEALHAPRLYMADGHHRYETALAYRDEMRGKGSGGSGTFPYDFAMVLLVDARDPGLVVLPTHRMVRGLDPARLAALDGALPALFDVEVVTDGIEGVTPAMELLDRMGKDGGERRAVGIYRRGENGAAVLRLREQVDPPEGNRPLLDVDVLHDLLLAPLGVGPEQLRAGDRVSYTRDASAAVAAVDRGDAQAAFLLNPTPVEQVLETARAGGKMPQKSTYFYPKPVTGLVIHRL